MMSETIPARKIQTVSVTVREFQQRLDELRTVNSSLNRGIEGVSVYSRLALIHQVAKAYALDATTSLVNFPIELAIEEITNPPVYDFDNGDELVVIQFSYDD